MVHVWKIAPGPGAENWELFRDHRCIGLGWDKLPDYGRYRSEGEVLAALEQQYGKRAPGSGAGAAEMIWRFYDEIKPGHIVVANEGYNRVVGIGLITSEYLAPASQRNPLRDDRTTHRHHVRLVDWVVTEAVDLPGPRFFVQSALWPLGAGQFEQVTQEYVKNFPPMRPTFDALLSGRRSATAEMEYEEGQRRVREQSYFKRNPRLVADAKERYGFRCTVCNFDFAERYGPLGEGFIECHHLSPLSEADDAEARIGTKLDDVTVLCANCHRMVHRTIPAMKPEELKKRLQ